MSTPRWIRPTAVTIAAALTCGIALSVGGCPADTTGPDDDDTGKIAGSGTLKRFASPDDLVNYFRTRVADQVEPNTRNSFWMFADDVVFAPSATAGSGIEAADAGGSAPPTDSVSQTNTQEADVDESDIVKTDGQNIFIARGEKLSIVRGAPRAEMALLSEIDFDAPVSEMYLTDSRVIMLAQSYGDPMPYYGGRGGAAIDIMIWPPYYRSAKTVLFQVDVSNPASPTIEKRVELDGSVISSRVTDGRLFLVMTIVPEIPPAPTRSEIANISLDDIMPQIEGPNGPRDLIPWQSWYFPDPENGWYTTAVVSLDVTDVEKVISSAAVMASAGTVYASTEAIYVSDTDYTTDGVYRETTLIHKFAIGDDGGATYVASGSVDGRLLNQFSLDEHDGKLRVATHIPTPFRLEPAPAASDDSVSSDGSTATVSTAQDLTPPPPSNAVFVLGEADGKLNVVGSITGIAPNERIYSARFMGDYGFLVTFRQIDPLFTMDLSDATAPKIVGELKIPGFSDYLHPAGDGLLIGLGRSVTTTEWGGVVPDRLQLSLFDVSDLTNPTVIQQLEIGGQWSFSPANSNHKAFTFLPDRNLLAFPATMTNASVRFDYNYEQRTALIVYDVSPSGFTWRGELEFLGDQYYYGGGETRGVIINDDIYAVDTTGIRAATLGDFVATTDLELPDLGLPEYGDGFPADEGVATRP
ncbi:MAG: beta-propeller domain-containing protein [Phycisphaerae bacterium]